MISDGGAAISVNGLCWSLLANPTINDAKIVNATGNGTFTVSLTGLASGTSYHVRAYASNSVGTSYGSEVIFTTPTLPVVSTSGATATSATTAVFGGEVTSDGGSTVTSKGLCWSTNLKPTVSDNMTTNGTGIGSFSSNISGLITGTSYHIRAFATNSVGTVYGDDVAFAIAVNGGIFNVSMFYQIYPNPSNGKITIRNTEDIATEVSIYSLQGLLMRNYQLNGQVNILDLKLARGIYTVVMSSKKATGSYKLVIL